MNIIVFAAHPDDETIGCGGTIMKHVLDGDRVATIFFTSGSAFEEIARERETEALNAARILGTYESIFLRYPDQGLKYSRSIANRIESIFRDEKPDIIYVHHGTDMHPDHWNAYLIVKKISDSHARPLICRTYEVWSPMLFYDYVSDITMTFESKLLALSEYKSQLKDRRYDDLARGLNRYRGVTTHRGLYVEVFGDIKKSKTTKLKRIYKLLRGI